MSRLPEGTRVRAVEFYVDPGLRIWPVDPTNNEWRLVLVEHANDGAPVIEEKDRGGSHELQVKYPHATFGINDNETVPPGTLGTVVLADASNTFVHWDNGSRLGVTERDRIERV